MAMPKFNILIAIPLFTLLVTSSPTLNAAEPYQVTVMSRNIYLGADVGVALELIPNFPKAAQFMWDQVKATDFNKRARKLAAEAAAEKPDLIGVQEATRWYCKKNLWDDQIAVFDFLDQLIKTTETTGVSYKLAEANGVSAFNPGYSISAVPYLTKVKDPEIFPALFGSDTAACGFTIGDAILVRSDLAPNVKQVGNTEFDQTYSIVPTIMTIYRGYTWVDFAVSDSIVRVVSTHLESIWDENKIPNSAIQAKQLVSDLASAKMPVIVMGDFNADYRDPRPVGAPNPGEQPVVSEACPTPGSAECNAYKTMLEAGFKNASPDAEDPKFFSWGAAALLDGPDPKRAEVAASYGNQYGFTDRLDYILTKNVYANSSSKMIGAIYPDGSSIWDCGEAGEKKCFASDHAGVVATIELPRGAGAVDPALPDHARFPLGFWHVVAIAIISLISWRIFLRIRR
jgi:endonuclease/exonuclease/phosphatase family metal-dependent hydrolase